MAFDLPKQVPARTRLIDVGGARLAVSDTGGAGEAVVLCHPASQSSPIWSHQQPALAQAGYRVVAYARRGFSPSDACHADSLGTEVGDLAHILDALGVGRIHLLGAAAGGGVAMRFAVAHTYRVSSLILAGTVLSPAEADWRVAYDCLGIAAVKDHVPVEFLELGPSYRAGNPEGAAKFAELSRQARSGARTRQPAGITLTWAAMERTRVPTLLLTGEADLYAPPPLQRLHASHLPVHETATIREAGHSAYWEAPGTFNALVLEFLARHRAGSGTARTP